MVGAAQTHGGGIDKPLSIYRMDYDTLFPTTQIVAPHTDSRGAYEAGTHFAAGISMPCVTLPQVDADAQGYPSDDPENPPAPHPDSVQVCVKLDFPAAKQWMSYKPRNTSTVGTYAWWGSLIDGGRDASGQMYMRNRYYDPGTGRFTQEDPIGLAGGLNLYGFASGDPVNFSDPYGLSPSDTIFSSGALQARILAAAERMPSLAQELDAMANDPSVLVMFGEADLDNPGMVMSPVDAGGLRTIAVFFDFDEMEERAVRPNVIFGGGINEAAVIGHEIYGHARAFRLRGDCLDEDGCARREENVVRAEAMMLPRTW